MKWISVDDEPPPKGKRVLCSDGIAVEWGGLFESFYDDDLKMRWLVGLKTKITHWMPEPDPPRD